MAIIAPSNDTIVALATPPGRGAIAIIRVSGPRAISMVDRVFPAKELAKQKSHTLHLGSLYDHSRELDQVLVSLFKGPRSYTKEDLVEISTHGSPFVIQEVIKLLLSRGARLAQAGEFTQRAFLNGQFDLAQAEAVADLIACDSKAAHATAMNQMRGGFSGEIKELRKDLVHFASLIELELDFSEEDVEFASRKEVANLVKILKKKIRLLLSSFELGNVIKNGVPTVIAGKPNAGKSTLLNALLNEERAIVSEIPGTTRDVIEDEINIEGIHFRFIDTAGLRETKDSIEALGVERTRQKMEKAALILYIFDLSHESCDEIKSQIEQLQKRHAPFIAVGNKVDLSDPALLTQLEDQKEMLAISALKRDDIDRLKQVILSQVHADKIDSDQTIITNLRHYDSLTETSKALEGVLQGIDQNITNDLLAQDLKIALYHLGEITGEITTDDLLENIFSKFCIGK